MIEARRKPVGERGVDGDAGAGLGHAQLEREVAGRVGRERLAGDGKRAQRRGDRAFEQEGRLGQGAGGEAKRHARLLVARHDEAAALGALDPEDVARARRRRGRRAAR